MNTRRRFFKSLAGFVATVALAPEICFRTKLSIAKAEKPLHLVPLFEEVKRLRGGYFNDGYIEIMTDRLTAQKIKTALLQYQDSRPLSQSKAQNF